MEKLASKLAGVKTVAIAGHVRPDGDCIGSCMGLYLYLKENEPDIKCDVYLETAKEGFSYIKNLEEAKQEYEFSKEEVSSLSIETEEKNAIYLEFKTDANANSIKVKSYNSADVVEYDREDRELSIERKGKNHQGEKDPIEIILPQDMQFESVTVEMNGGGQLVIDKLNAASLDLEVGAGVLQVSDELRAQECEIEVGAGEVSVAKLDAKVSDISCGTGTVDIKMAGKREDYSAEAEVGMGTVQVGDNVLSSGFGNEFSDKNDTGKELSIDCGMGTVQITFES